MPEAEANPKNTPLTRRRIILVLLSLLIVAASITAVAIHLYRRHKLFYHFTTVEDGKLYRSGTLSETGLRLLAESPGIKTIVNLRSETENEGEWYKMEKNFAETNGVELIDIPMEAGVPPSAAQIAEWRRLINDPAKYPILVHCAQGFVRTGMMVTIYRTELMGQTAKEAYDIMPRFNHKWERSPKAMNFILSYSPEADSASPEAPAPSGKSGGETPPR